MNINGVELEFSIADVDTLERYLKATDKCSDTCGNLSHDGTASGIAKMSASACEAMKRVFDDLFGDGTGVKVCGKANNTKICRDAYSQLAEEYYAQIEEEQKENEKMHALLNRG